MNWDQIIELHVNTNSLKAEDAVSFGKFINGFIKTEKAKPLQEKGCDTDFIAYLFLSYGYAYKRDRRLEPLINNALKALQRIDPKVGNLLGIDINEKLNYAIKIKESIGIGFKSPTGSFNQPKKGEKGGRYKEWQITAFVNCLNEYLSKASVRPRQKIILQILDYFPPWVKGFKDARPIEDYQLDRFKKHLGKKPEHFTTIYEHVMYAYEHWKGFWELPEDIRQEDLDALLSYKEKNRDKDTIHRQPEKVTSKGKFQKKNI